MEPHTEPTGFLPLLLGPLKLVLPRTRVAENGVGSRAQAGQGFTVFLHAGKGRRLNKRMREQRWTTGPQDIISMNVHVDL